MSSDSNLCGTCSQTLREHGKSSPGLLPLSESRVSDTYFGNDVYDSPDSGSSDTEDILSDATLEDGEILAFGYPLQRMPNATSTSDLDIYQQISVLLKVSPRSSDIPSRSTSFTSSMSVTNHEDMYVLGASHHGTLFIRQVAITTKSSTRCSTESQIHFCCTIPETWLVPTGMGTYYNNHFSGPI